MLLLREDPLRGDAEDGGKHRHGERAYARPALPVTPPQLHRCGLSHRAAAQGAGSFYAGAPATGGSASTYARSVARSSCSAASRSTDSRPQAACSWSPIGTPLECNPTGALIPGIPARLPSPDWRTLAASAGYWPEGSSTSGASIGGAGAGTVGHARTPQGPKALTSDPRGLARMRAAPTSSSAGSNFSYFTSARMIGSAPARSSGPIVCSPSSVSRRTAAICACSAPAISTSCSGHPEVSSASSHAR